MALWKSYRCLCTSAGFYAASLIRDYRGSIQIEVRCLRLQENNQPFPKRFFSDQTPLSNNTIKHRHDLVVKVHISIMEYNYFSGLNPVEKKASIWPCFMKYVSTIISVSSLIIIKWFSQIPSASQHVSLKLTMQTQSFLLLLELT